MPSENKILIEFSARFDKKLRSLSPEIISSFNDSIDLLLENPYHNALRRHFLKDEYTGY